MSDNGRCAVCGEFESEHHIFEPMPAGCVCHPGEWLYADPIPQVCESYVGGGGDDPCGTCEHDRECHSSEDEPSYDESTFHQHSGKFAEND